MRTTLRMVLVMAGAGLATLLNGASPAAAHPMPHSVVLLDVHPMSVGAELRLPVQDLSLASGLDLSDLPSAPPVSETIALRAYLRAHLRPTTPTGERWNVRIGTVSLTRSAQTSTGPYRELVAEAVLTPPAGADVRRFTLHYDAIVHQVVTHIVLVSLRRDWGAGRVNGASTQVGVIQTDTRSMTVSPLAVDLGAGSAWRGFAAMVELGGRHILEGTDHLLFLLALLLTAPLVAVRGRWRTRAGARPALRRIGWITLAFTLGHSAALATSALSRFKFPAQPVEVFIAASILLSAVHAIRPLFPGREALVAAVFGLGHGMAFSLALAQMQLSTRQLAQSLLGFNLGIELVQVFLVALALPTLLALARLRAQSVLRMVGAAFIAVAALGWLFDRLGRPNAVARLADSLGAHPSATAISLVAAAVAASCWALATTRRAGERAGEKQSTEPGPREPVLQAQG